MSTLINSSASGLEQIELAAFYVVFEHLNSYFARVQDAWRQTDEEFATRTGRQFVEAVLEPIESANFHKGHRPSLIQAPMSEYPNCAVMVPRSTKGPGSDQMDHGFVASQMLIVELMTHVEPGVDIDVLNRKAHRIGEAAEVCFAEHNTLGGAISPFAGPPTISLGGVFTRQRKEGRGKDWYWQGARLEFSLTKHGTEPLATARDPFFTPSYDQQ